MKIGTYIKQSEGFKSFALDIFPPKEGFSFSDNIAKKNNEATLALGKLDGISYLVPDIDFFIFMYIRKDAESSSQIEGTKATMMDAMEAEVGIDTGLPTDVDDITHYINALNYGLDRLKKFPLSLRFIRELHEKLMRGARSTHHALPGEFRSTQNWIGGTRPNNASYVPPSVPDMQTALNDLEKYLHHEDSTLPIIKTALIHAQFETIHPFLDGNGRTGRLLISLYLWANGLLERPMLYLSTYFKKHQKTYYNRLNGYHNGKANEWVDFFLEGVTETAYDGIETAKKITVLREDDMCKIQALNKAASYSALKVLPRLYELPFVNVAKIQEWTGFSRPGAQSVIDRFVDMGILTIKNEDVKYGRFYIYQKYINLFD